MRILLESYHPCHSSRRIEQGLARDAPRSTEIVPAGAVGYQFKVTEAERRSDLVLLHVGGRWTQVRNRVARLREAGVPYAVLQLVIRGTQHPDTGDWLDLWRGAAFVWSYYDLERMVREDGHDPAGISFYRSPLGVDPMTFAPTAPSGSTRHYLAFAEGDNSERDSLTQIIRAVRREHGRMIHLGPFPISGPTRATRVMWKKNVTDDELVSLYNQTQWITALRTVEGFELCAAEGLMCGARPILFDRQHHRDWFGDLAEYVPEDTTDLMVQWLRELFAEGPRPVTAEEHAEAKERFAWTPIAKGFWDAVQTWEAA